MTDTESQPEASTNQAPGTPADVSAGTSFRKCIAWLFVLTSAVLISALAGYRMPGNDYGPGPVIISLVFGCAGVRVLRRIWDTRRALRAFIPVAVLFFSLGIILGNMHERWVEERNQFLVSYADSHWINIPGKPKLLSTERLRNGCTKFVLLMEDRIITRSGISHECRYLVNMYVKELGGRRFRFPAYHSEQHGPPNVEISELLDIKTVKEAKKALGHHGLDDKALHYRGASTDETSFDNKRWVPYTYWKFYAAEKDAVFLVSWSGVAVYPDKDCVVSM